jgi:hypothetical protein
MQGGRMGTGSVSILWCRGRNVFIICSPRGCEYIEIIEIKAEGGRLRLNDGGWDNPQGTFDEELDKFFPLWTS